MSKPYAIDVDDVLGALSSVLAPELNRISGKELEVSQWHTFNCEELYGIGQDALLNCIIENDLLTVMAPVPGASESMQRLQEAGKRLVLVTARGYHPQALSVTEQWLNTHHIPFDDLIIVPEGMSKGQCTQALYPKGFALMVDDHATNLDSMNDAKMADRTILIDRPWNQHRDDYVLGSQRFTGMDHFTRLYLQLQAPSRTRTWSAELTT